MDYFAIQFYDIIPAPYVESVCLTTFCGQMVVKHLSNAISAFLFCTVVGNEVSYNGQSVSALWSRAGWVHPDGVSTAAIEAPPLESFLNGGGEQVDPFSQRIDAWWERTEEAKASEHYYYFQPVDALEGPWVHTGGKRKLMFATYSYLGLINHPRIVAAAKAAADKYGTGTHGVRILGGTLDLHTEMERTIADFARREEAIVYSSGYVTNLATVSTIVGRGDWVFSDRWNHASYCRWLSVGPRQIRPLPS